MLDITVSDDLRVRIREAPETEALGVARMIGLAFGYTTPSDTKVTVVGDTSDDLALGVQLEGRDEVLWFAPALVERVTPWRPRGAWAVNEPRARDETPVTRLLAWMEQFLPRLGPGKDT
jgi:hypothetical protein